ncbi:MAG: serine hydrolase domain-containing protein [Actinomycetota bacterium]|nr:serine hydrolase domain-containing protein [Actinomycetota bacterium]
MTEGTFAPDLVDPREVGMDAERLQRLKQAVEEDTARGVYDGAVFVVARHGKVVMHEAVGKTDLEKGRRAALDDVFFIMSITKKITAVRVLMDVEKGKFQLNTPVAEVIPEFGMKGKQRVTVHHILTHTSGLNTELPYGIPVDQLGDIEAVVAAMSNERVLYTPGTSVSYNPICAHSVLAVMVTRLDEAGRPFRRILAEDLFDPLGMDSTALGVPDRLRDRLVPVVVRDRTPGLFEPLLLEALNFLAQEDTELPAGGGISTAMDICRFAEMLRRGGELNGTRILAPETVRLATSNQTGDMVNHLWDYAREMYGWPVFPAYLGLTFFLRGEGVFPTPLGLTASPGTFAGLGAGSTMFWVDPERDLTFVLLTAGLLEEGPSVLRHQRLSDLVIAAVSD